MEKKEDEDEISKEKEAAIQICFDNRGTRGNPFQRKNITASFYR